ncbi:MAG: 23S rRNA pseudouridine(1911/1915/1917) synthase RluD [Betaproteobacteria bacterium]|nr:MAG: 23S rRNA pseudouridine(1911/1915/1917) synthase RluD [Betaproteobacteria bacterium]
MTAKNELSYYNAKFSRPRPTENIIELIIPQNCAGLRLDQALAQLLPDQSRTRLQGWILKRRITIDDLEANSKEKVWGGEKIKIKPPQHPTETAYAAEAIKLDIVYEDQALIVINKPAGMVVHPGNDNWHGTLLNGLLHHAAQLNGIPRAGIVHRLDKNTSGLLVVAKTLEAQTSLVRQLQNRTMKRDYFALVLGRVTIDGWVNTPIGRHPIQRVKMAVTKNGKEACTRYLVIEQLCGCTLLQCSLETGRTHQIRVHMHSIGHPLVGDPIYSNKPRKVAHEVRRLVMNFPRQALHAQRLELTHPKTGQTVMWETGLPEDLEKLLLTLRQYHENCLPSK